MVLSGVEKVALGHVFSEYHFFIIGLHFKDFWGRCGIKDHKMAKLTVGIEPILFSFGRWRI